MQVHRSIDTLPPFVKAVITIGTFDGVHQGHRQLIEALKAEASAVGGQSVIITFNPHPRKVVRPSAHLELINTLEEKTGLLSLSGIDHLVIVPFTPHFAALTAHEYISSFLIDRFHPHTIIIGYDHHFGKGREGNFNLLQEQAGVYGYKLLEIPKYILDQIAVSSTQIRQALLNSQVDVAARLLGYDFFFEGLVVHGDQIGRQIGYPTANLEYTDADKIRLGHGVYAVQARIGSEVRKGMLSIGNRPTLTGSDERVEVNLFDWNKEIYGEKMTVIVKKYLRPQEKYASLDELKQQLALDKEQTLRVLEGQ